MNIPNGAALIDVQGVKSMVKRTPSGFVHSTMARVPLSVQRDEIYLMNRYNPSTREYETKNVITAAGYHKLNQFAGVSFISPDTLTNDDGTIVGNPYSHASGDATSKKEVQYVRVRRVGIGRNAQGNWVAIDLTVTYDLTLYFAQDMWAAWQGKKSSPSSAKWGSLYSTENVPHEVRTNPQLRIIDCPGGVSLAVDLNARPVVALFQEHINRQKFAERNAVTICERNILKKFFATSRVGTDMTVPVISWPQVDLDLQQIDNITRAVSRGSAVIDGEEVIVESAVIEADQDEAEAALAGEYDEDQASDSDDDDLPASVTGTKTKTAQTKTAQADISDDAVDLSKIRAIYRKCDQDERKAALASVGITDPKALPEADPAKLKLLLTILQAHIEDKENTSS